MRMVEANYNWKGLTEQNFLCSFEEYVSSYILKAYDNPEEAAAAIADLIRASSERDSVSTVYFAPNKSMDARICGSLDEECLNVLRRLGIPTDVRVTIQ